MIQHWTLAKHGNSPEENEDASAEGAGIVVVADGVTDAYESRRWAQLLVKDLVACDAAAYHADPDGCFWQQVSAAQIRWADWLGGEALAWNERQKAALGSSAAVALLLPRPQARRARMLACGDVLIVRVRADASVWTWPLVSADQFTNRPSLISSRLTAPGRVATVEASYQQGDQWLLLTDALAAWALQRAEVETPVWDQLVAIADESTWQQFVSAARQAGLKNDDVTLVRWGRRRRRSQKG